ncbi:MAG: hypothetical protein V8R55_14085 [Dysosmobacter sp.]
MGEAPVDTTAPPRNWSSALGNALKGAVEDGAQQLEIRLSPENLGTVAADLPAPEGSAPCGAAGGDPQAAKLLGDHAGALGLLLQDENPRSGPRGSPQPQQDQQPWQQPDQEGAGQQQQQQQQRHVPTTGGGIVPPPASAGPVGRRRRRSM